MKERFFHSFFINAKMILSTEVQKFPDPDSAGQLWIIT